MAAFASLTLIEQRYAHNHSSNSCSFGLFIWLFIWFVYLVCLFGLFIWFVYLVVYLVCLFGLFIWLFIWFVYLVCLFGCLFIVFCLSLLHVHMSFFFSFSSSCGGGAFALSSFNHHARASRVAPRVGGRCSGLALLGSNRHQRRL